jgi:hypothetical protein
MDFEEQYIAEEENFFATTLPCKLKAIEILARMTGYNEPEKIEVKTEGNLEHVINALRVTFPTESQYCLAASQRGDDPDH